MSPTYPLSLVRKLMAEERWVVTAVAQRDMLALGFDDDDLRLVVSSLAETSFYKTMPAQKAPGFWQDVYKVEYEQVRLYVKIQIRERPEAVVVVISFKLDESVAT